MQPIIKKKKKRKERRIKATGLTLKDLSNLALHHSGTFYSQRSETSLTTCPMAEPQPFVTVLTSLRIRHTLLTFLPSRPCSSQRVELGSLGFRSLLSLFQPKTDFPFLDSYCLCFRCGHLALSCISFISSLYIYT